jgi:hypothetical protein
VHDIGNKISKKIGFENKIWSQISEANPTIASYNARVVNFYNATGSLARFENENNFFLL